MIELVLRLTPPLTLLLALLLLLRPWVLERFGARLQYGLWLCVPVLLLALIVPMASPASGNAMETYRVTLGELSHGAGKTDWLNAAYVTGLVLAVSVLGLSLLRLARLMQGAKPVASTTYTNNRLRLLASTDAQGPFVFGLFRPTVVLPEGFEARFNHKEQELILAHELSHWRRGDLHCNLLALALLCLCWFNPLCLLAYRRFRQDQEMACDADVTIELSQADRIAYGRALIGNAATVARSWQPLSHHYGDKHTMKQRLIQLKHSKGFSANSLLTPLALVAALGIWAQAPAMAGDHKEEARPVVRIEPKYPINAAKQGIEGYVQARFDIDAKGNVSNVVIFKSEPQGVFDKVSIDALNQWQYEPRATKAVEIQLDYRLTPPQASSQKPGDGERERIAVLPHNEEKH
ncbi:M56 family metallopeptidase [Shewanella litorisediminis]|uniref:Protein TonB n=1 Tax=Shewanella litorisediminis TaxID=1173586 RepID=A0ABX7G339_9GAMM|nr:TonB family protein [Shewanella litorisediminis]MCL2917073.1 TonB family protein [Shewanella litorisediminis]QRH01553.1 TonB family protein [Shewanella litorisediminis]